MICMIFGYFWLRREKNAWILLPMQLHALMHSDLFNGFQINLISVLSIDCFIIRSWLYIIPVSLILLCKFLIVTESDKMYLWLIEISITKFFYSLLFIPIIICDPVWQNQAYPTSIILKIWFVWTVTIHLSF